MRKRRIPIKRGWKLRPRPATKRSFPPDMFIELMCPKIWEEDHFVIMRYNLKSGRDVTDFKWMCAAYKAILRAMEPLTDID